MKSAKMGRLPDRALAAVFLWLCLALLTACNAAPEPSPTPTSNPTLPTPPTAGQPNALFPTATPIFEAATATAVEPASEPPATARFAVIGDYGEAGEPLAAVAALIKSWSPDYILTTGDNNYPSGAAETIDENIGQYFAEYIGNYHGIYGEGAPENRFYPVLGNHDVDTDNGQAYFDYFTLPGNERYYDVVLGPVHLFALNSDWREPDGIGQSSVQAKWLEEGLAASNAPWKIVLLHAAPYASGIYGSYDPVQWPFAKWGADAVVAGHEHIYERLTIDGIPYLINGLGGGAIYDIEEVHPASEVRYNDGYGAMLIDASAEAVEFSFASTAGEIIDSFTLGEQRTAEAQEMEISRNNAAQLPNPNDFTWEPYASDLESPVGMIEFPEHSGRQAVIEQRGVLRVVENGQTREEPFLDLRDRVGAGGNEQGLLGLAFHPRYNENGLFFVNYTDLEGDTIIARYQVTDDPNRADPDAEMVLLKIDQPYSNHNGGHILFGPDGYLYIGMGDGGSAGDPEDNAQNLETLLGKILRIDVDGGEPYGIPADNPYADGGGRAEIFIYGVRNPWTFSFDRATGDLYVADVGQVAWEEVSVLAPDSQPRANLGWDYREGPAAFEGQAPDSLALVEPVVWYDHSLGCSITGGDVYRGEALPEFQGVYLFADYCTGFVWGLLRLPDGEWQRDMLFQTGERVSAFGQDAAGNIFLVGRGGTIYRLVKK